MLITNYAFDNINTFRYIFTNLDVKLLIYIFYASLILFKNSVVYMLYMPICLSSSYFDILLRSLDSYHTYYLDTLEVASASNY